MRSLVLIPEGKISWGKLSQSLDYGAVTCQLRTDFDGCVKVLNELVRRKPIYLLNSVNPYRLEGQKTAAIELLEQLNWQPPDHIIVPGGNLGNSSALGESFFPEHSRIRRKEARAHASRDAGHGDPHRQSSVLEESSTRDSGHRWCG